MPAEPEEDGALSWLIPAIIGGLTLYVAYQQYKRVNGRALGSPTYQGRVVARDGRPTATGGPLNGVQGAALSAHVGDETLDQALRRVRSRAGLPKRKTVNMTTVEERLAEIGRLIHDGSYDDDVKAAAQAVLTRKCGDRWCVAPKDYAGESDAIFNAVVDPTSPIAMRYTLDHPTTDEFGSAARGLRMRAGDCLPGVTKLLTPSGFKPIADIRPGDVVMGDGQWVKVTQWWDKGVLPVRGLQLNTGSRLICTDEHRLFVVPKRYYPRDNAAGRSSSKLPGQRGEEVEMLAGDVSEGDHLLTPASFPAGRLALTADDAWLLGAFVADGWVDDNRVAVSGKDGYPKEEQKRRVEAIAKAKGWPTYWHKRYLRFTPDAEWFALFSACGRGATNKHLPTTDVTVETARALLTGLAADASIANSGTVTYGTTSVELALQLRVLHRILGERTNIRRVDEHGGLGTNPIYRVSVIRARADGVRSNDFAIVQDVVADLGEEHVYDIEVEGHRFYLPEHDVVVHNCDDLVIYYGALAASIGHRPELVIMQAKGSNSWSHILLREPMNLDDGTGAGQQEYRYFDPSMQFGHGWMPPGYAPPGLEAALSGYPGSGITERAQAFRIFP